MTKMKNETITFWVGPHHGEHRIPSDNDNPYSKNVTIEERYLDDDEGPEQDQFIAKLKKIYHGEFELDEEWGTYSIITIHPWNEEEWLDKEVMTTYRDSIIKSWLKEYRGECLKAFLSAGGDDDTYDYVPSFMDTFEMTLECMAHFGALDHDGEYERKLFRYQLWLADPSYPEFFQEAEIEEFKTFKPKTK